MSTPTSSSASWGDVEADEKNIDEEALKTLPPRRGEARRYFARPNAGQPRPLLPRPDGSTHCPLCHDMGFVLQDVPVGHPDFGRAVPCTCQEQERMERRMTRMLRMSNLTGMEALTFQNFVPEPSWLASDKISTLRRAFDECRHFADDPEGWLLLTGTYGCGKTHLAAAIANECLARGKAALFLVVPDLLDHLRAAFSPQAHVRYDELFDQMRNISLLILDDLGTQSSTPWAQEKLFQLLNHRYNAMLPTVITTNHRLESMDQRLRSRLMDIRVVTHLPILAPDFRAGSNPAQSDLSTLHLHRDQTFDSFNVDRADLDGEERVNLRDVVKASQKFAQNPQGWIVLAGTNGCGKTHLAAAISNYQLDHALSDVMLIVVPDLLDHLRAAFSRRRARPTTAASTRSSRRRCWCWTIWARRAPRPGRARSCSSCSTSATARACPPSSPPAPGRTTSSRGCARACLIWSAVSFGASSRPATAAAAASRMRAASERRSDRQVDQRGARGVKDWRSINLSRKASFHPAPRGSPQQRESAALPMMGRELLWGRRSIGSSPKLGEAGRGWRLRRSRKPASAACQPPFAQLV